MLIVCNLIITTGDEIYPMNPFVRGVDVGYYCKTKENRPLIGPVEVLFFSILVVVVVMNVVVVVVVIIVREQLTDKIKKMTPDIL
jgi:hypothetical protein